MSTKIVVVNHITYDNKHEEEDYYFKTMDEVKKGDIVLCETKHGASLGVVKRAVENMSIDDLLNSELFYRLISKNIPIKECKLLPDYSKIKL